MRHFKARGGKEQGMPQLTTQSCPPLLYTNPSDLPFPPPSTSCADHAKARPSLPPSIHPPPPSTSASSHLCMPYLRGLVVAGAPFPVAVVVVGVAASAASLLPPRCTICYPYCVCVCGCRVRARRARMDGIVRISRLLASRDLMANPQSHHNHIHPYIYPHTQAGLRAPVRPAAPIPWPPGTAGPSFFSL